MQLESLVRVARQDYRKVRRRLSHWAHAATDMRPKLLILVYHRVLPEPGWNDLQTKVSLKTFQRQLDAIASRYPITPLGEAIRRCRRGEAMPPVTVALTFDDGYWDHYEIVLPVLQQKGLPATFCIVTNAVDTARPVWDWELVMRLKDRRDAPSIDLAGERLTPRPAEPHWLFVLRVLERMKAASWSAIQRLLAQLSADDGSYDPRDDRCLSWEQVRGLVDHSMEVGAHSLSHRSLARLPFDEAVQEIEHSKAAIERQRLSCAHFAFPFGSQRDYSPSLIEHVARSGFDTSLLNVHGYNPIGDAGGAFQRIIMTESTDVRFLLG